MHAGCRKQLEPVPLPTDRRALGRSLDTHMHGVNSGSGFKQPREMSSLVWSRTRCRDTLFATKISLSFPLLAQGRVLFHTARAHSHRCEAVDATAAISGERSRHGQFDVMHQATTEPHHPTPRFTPEVEGLEAYGEKPEAANDASPAGKREIYAFRQCGDRAPPGVRRWRASCSSPSQPQRAFFSSVARASRLRLHSRHCSFLLTKLMWLLLALLRLGTRPRSPPALPDHKT